MQDPTGPQAPQGTQMAGTRPQRMHPRQTTAAALRSQSRGWWGGGSLPPQGLGQTMARALNPVRHKPQPVPRVPQAHRWPEAR